jgi:GNAT superfamily N-acetyltransferase
LDDPLVIRPAASDDAAAVLDIYVKSSNAAFAPYRLSMSVTPERLARWEQDLRSPRHRWWLAAWAGEPAGVAGIGPSRDPVEEGLGELDTIAVSPAHWRRGIGRALIAVAHEHLDREYRSAILWTWAHYEMGEAFYTSAGWRPTGVTRDGGRQMSWRRP